MRLHLEIIFDRSDYLQKMLGRLQSSFEVVGRKNGLSKEVADFQFGRVEKKMKCKGVFFARCQQVRGVYCRMAKN